MEILTDFDKLVDAMSKIDLNESVMPMVNGRLVDADSYNKVQKILNTPEMIGSHKWILDRDLDNLSEDEIDRIDRLYKLGCDRGFICDPSADEPAEPETTPVEKSITPVAQPAVAQPTGFKAKVPCFTIIYSAMKNGQVKTGETYSNAISTTAAKADAYAKLSRCGYDNISILAIEVCDDDVCHEPESTAIDDAPAAVEDVVAEPVDDMNESGNPYLKGMKTNNIGGTTSVIKKAAKPAAKKSVKEDDDSAGDSPKSEKSEPKAEPEKNEEPKPEKKEEKKDDASSEDAGDDTPDFSAPDDSTDNNEGSEETEPEDKKDAESDDASADSTEDSIAADDSTSEAPEKTDDGSEAEDKEPAKTDDAKLDDNAKQELKDEYKRIFKNTLVKCKFEKCFNDLTLDEKIKFFTELQRVWKKNEPNEFMSDKEIEQLNRIVVKQ